MKRQLLQCIIISTLCLLVYSCRPYSAVYKDGKYATYVKSKKLNALLFPFCITGTRTTVDTLTQHVISRTKFRHSLGFLSLLPHSNYESTVTYGENRQPLKRVTIRGQKKVTTEYMFTRGR